MAKGRAVKRQQRCARRRMGLRRFIKSFPPFLLILALAVPVLAAENAGEKLAGGVGEAATGWAEVPREMADTTRDTNVIEGVTLGTVKGAGEAVVKTTKGVVDTATFYIPDKEDKE
ncbi:MAG: exosortase system-associated protein, TIGR04073 family [Dehalococcoidia bacterium]|nr:MAG: exosortase system-associated protein, TIGR04073 family [Dehalococcoidia bacterium]